jgi:hypothetical protein
LLCCTQKPYGCNAEQKRSKSARSSRDTSREASSESEGEDSHSFRKRISGLGVIEEEQEDPLSPRRRAGCSGVGADSTEIATLSGTTMATAEVPYHPLIDKVGRVFDDRVAAFKQSLKRSLQEEMTTVLARLDTLDAELTETKRRAELNKVTKLARGSAALQRC